MYKVLLINSVFDTAVPLKGKIKGLLKNKSKMGTVLVPEFVGGNHIISRSPIIPLNSFAAQEPKLFLLIFDHFTPRTV